MKLQATGWKKNLIEEEIKIKDLVIMIKELSSFEGQVEWDTSKPDGQPRRRLDTTRAKCEFGFEAKTGLREGLQETIAWYKGHSK